MSTNNYSEEDIQDYAAGIFEGDKSLFEEYLKSNPQVSSQVREYQTLFNMLAADQSPSLSIDLSSSVLEKINQKEFSKEPLQYQLLQFLVISLTIMGLSIIYRQLGFVLDLSAIFESGIYLGSALLIVFVLSGFYLIEIRQIRRKLSV